MSDPRSLGFAPVINPFAARKAIQTSGSTLGDSASLYARDGSAFAGGDFWDAVRDMSSALLIPIDINCKRTSAAIAT